MLPIQGVTERCERLKVTFRIVHRNIILKIFMIFDNPNERSVLTYLQRLSHRIHTSHLTVVLHKPADMLLGLHQEPG